MMNYQKYYKIISISLLLLLLFLSSACFLFGENVKPQEETGNIEAKDIEIKEEEEIIDNEKPEDKEAYVEDMDKLINELRAALKKVEEAAIKFENDEIRISEIDNYINAYIKSIGETNAKFLKVEPPEDAIEIQNSFSNSMEKFLSSTESLEKYLKTSILNMEQKIKYLEQAYKQGQEAEILLNETETKLNEYKGE